MSSVLRRSSRLRGEAPAAPSPVLRLSSRRNPKSRRVKTPTASVPRGKAARTATQKPDVKRTSSQKENKKPAAATPALRRKKGPVKIKVSSKKKTPKSARPAVKRTLRKPVRRLSDIASRDVSTEASEDDEEEEEEEAKVVPVKEKKTTAPTTERSKRPAKRKERPGATPRKVRKPTVQLRRSSRLTAFASSQKVRQASPPPVAPPTAPPANKPALKPRSHLESLSNGDTEIIETELETDSEAEAEQANDHDADVQKPKPYVPMQEKYGKLLRFPGSQVETTATTAKEISPSQRVRASDYAALFLVLALNSLYLVTFVRARQTRLVDGLPPFFGQWLVDKPDTMTTTVLSMLFYMAALFFANTWCRDWKDFYGWKTGSTSDLDPQGQKVMAGERAFALLHVAHALFTAANVLSAVFVARAQGGSEALVSSLQANCFLALGLYLAKAFDYAGGRPLGLHKMRDWFVVAFVVGFFSVGQLLDVVLLLAAKALLSGIVSRWYRIGGRPWFEVDLAQVVVLAVVAAWVPTGRCLLAFVS